MRKNHGRKYSCIKPDRGAFLLNLNDDEPDHYVLITDRKVKSLSLLEKSINIGSASSIANYLTVQDRIRLCCTSTFFRNTFNFQGLITREHKHISKLVKLFQLIKNSDTSYKRRSKNFLIYSALILCVGLGLVIFGLIQTVPVSSERDSIISDWNTSYSSQGGRLSCEEAFGPIASLPCTAHLNSSRKGVAVSDCQTDLDNYCNNSGNLGNKVIFGIMAALGVSGVGVLAFLLWALLKREAKCFFKPTLSKLDSESKALVLAGAEEHGLIVSEEMTLKKAMGLFKEVLSKAVVDLDFKTTEELESVIMQVYRD